MLRAACFIAGLFVLVTGQTPFDLTGHHLTAGENVELVVCVLVLVAGMAAGR